MLQARGHSCIRLLLPSPFLSGALNVGWTVLHKEGGEFEEARNNHVQNNTQSYSGGTCTFAGLSCPTLGWKLTLL
jgi:hypothetical protein